MFNSIMMKEIKIRFLFISFAKLKKIPNSRGLKLKQTAVATGRVHKYDDSFGKIIRQSTSGHLTVHILNPG